MAIFTTKKIPKTRIATIDVCEMGKRKHHVAAMLELDVTDSREMIRMLKQQKISISFTAWLIKTIAFTISQHQNAAAFLKGKNLYIFNRIDVSVMVEKEFNGEKVPIPLIIKDASAHTIQSITKQISEARKSKLTEREMVVQKKLSGLEMLYYRFPGFIRRQIWRYVLNHPELAFSKMGNVAVTSVGMAGNTSGWFIPISIHPVCFGINNVVKKPAVINNVIKIRELLNITVLVDHDIIDGAPVARFIRTLAKNIENAHGLTSEL